MGELGAVDVAELRRRSPDGPGDMIVAVAQRDDERPAYRIEPGPPVLGVNPAPFAPIGERELPIERSLENVAIGITRHSP